MQSFLDSLLKYDIPGKRSVSLRKGMLLDDVFSSQKMIVIIAQGVLEVFSMHGALISKLSQGQAYGISNLFCDNGLRSRMKAQSDVSLVLLPKEEVLKLLDSHIELYHAYCRILNEKLDFLLSRVNLLSVKSNRKRLAAYLLQSDGVSISSRQELADYLALGKSALFRELGWLRDTGAIRWEGACIEVIDEEKLLEVLNA